jgi:hypothetical protein
MEVQGFTVGCSAIGWISVLDEWFVSFHHIAMYMVTHTVGDPAAFIFGIKHGDSWFCRCTGNFQ